MSISKKVQAEKLSQKITTAEKACNLIEPGMTVAMGGFFSGYPKAMPRQLVEMAQGGHEKKINLWTGANVGEEIDGSLTQAGLIIRKLPFQSNAILRQAINRQQVRFSDIRFSRFGQFLRNNQLGTLNVAIIEASAITEEGGIIPTSAVGFDQAFVTAADQIIIEVNLKASPYFAGLHDVVVPGRVTSGFIPSLKNVADRIGSTTLRVDMDKVAAIVPSEDVEEPTTYTRNPVAEVIGKKIVKFLHGEVKEGRIPAAFLPIQAGLGSLANNVILQLAALEVEKLEFYGGLVDEAVFKLMLAGRVGAASGSALVPSPFCTEVLASALRHKLVLRSTEISNSPEVVRQLGVIAMNTALEADIYGHVNVSHILGSQLVNGIGGGGEFAREGHLSIFFLPSVSKGGKISNIVPMTPHVDHTEHDMDVLVTEQGLADLRGLDPEERARQIIDNCAHPHYRPALLDYLKRAKKEGGHEPHLLKEALSWHISLQESGQMLPE